MKDLRKTILVVEDNPKEELLYEQELADAGYRVMSAANGEEALQILETQLPDLVILDISLPGMNGMEVLSCIGLTYPHLPVILHSAYGAYKEDFISWAADAYVIKSSDLSALKARIAELLSAKSNTTSDRETDGTRGIGITQIVPQAPANFPSSIRTILCPVDFSPPSLAALETAGEWAAHWDAKLLVLYVEPYFQPMPNPISGALHALETDQSRCDRAMPRVNEVLDRCVSPMVQAQGLVDMGEVAHTITRIANEEEANLIIMATHGRSGWTHLALGSVAEKVVRMSSCPVLTLRGTAKEKNPESSQREVWKLPVQEVIGAAV
jgi:CheY-like chemotaxis protein/nucleotide-binding universal stress UspA family protein